VGSYPPLIAEGLCYTPAQSMWDLWHWDRHSYLTTSVIPYHCHSISAPHSIFHSSNLDATPFWHLMASHNKSNICSLSLSLPFLISTAYICLTPWLDTGL
jgi:hypothetical protein